MFAKMFYTLDETRSALGKNEEEIKQLTREGRLREFRDGPRLMFKADQVENLKAEIGSGDAVDLGPSDTGAPIGLADSKSASGSMISMADSKTGSRSGMNLGMSKDDTATAADIGLSGSLGGIPSPGRSRAGSGINLLGADESMADPMAQTAISGSVSDQVNLEGVGSGSGLLDLTRESDDTSLGAELLDEIAPGNRSKAGTRAGGSSLGGTGFGRPTLPGTRVNPVSGPAIREAYDSSSAAFGGMALAAALFALLGIATVASGAAGARPGFAEILRGQPILYVFGAGVVLAVIFFVVGMVMGKAAR